MSAVKAKSAYTVAVVGATGAVGQEMREILEERDFPVGKLVCLASERSEGKSVTFRGAEVPVDRLTERSFAGVDIALFSAGAERSRAFAPHAVAAAPRNSRRRRWKRARW